MVTGVSGRMRSRLKDIFRSFLGGKMDRTTNGLIHRVCCNLLIQARGQSGLQHMWEENLLA